MADLTYKATVDTTQAERSLNNLQKSVGGLNDTFLRLKSTLATISLGAIITQTMNMADAIADLSDATEVSIDNIIGFSRAVAANGGTAEGAQKGIAKLVASIDEAADKFGSSRQAFEEVGVSLDDLRRLSSEDIFKKTVEGLGKVEDVSKRNRLAVELLGKEFRSVNSAGVGASFAAANADSAKYAAATKSAADASDKLANALTTFQLQLTKALKPINDFIASIDPKSIEIFTDRLIKIGAGLAGIFVATKAAGWVRGLVDAFRSLGAAGAAGGTSVLMKDAAVGVKYLQQAFDLKSAAIVKSYTGYGIMGQTLKSLAGGLIRLAPLIGAVYAAFQVLDGIVESLTGRDLAGWFDEAALGLEKFVRSNIPGLADALDKLGEKLGMAPSPSAQRANEQEIARLKARAEAAKAASEELKRGQEAQRKIANEAQKQALANRQYVDDLAIGLSRQTEAIALEARMIELSKLSNVLSEDQVEIIKAQSDADVARLAAVKRLEDQQAKLRLDMSQTQDADQKKILANQIAGLDYQIAKTKEYYNGHNDALAENITRLQTARKLDAARLQDMENMKKAIEDQISRQQSLGDILANANRQAQEARDVVPAQQTVGLTSLQKQILELQENARKAALEAGRSFAATFPEEMSPEQVSEMAAGLDQIKEAYDRVWQAQSAVLEANYNLQRSFDTGLKDAWASFKETAMNNADQIKNSFTNFTSGLEDAFVRFVQTGKLSFNDLANSIIADLARIAVKKAIVGMASLFGFAAGGQVMEDTPIIVGERGPELFVPRTAGAIVPNNALGGLAAGAGAGQGQQTIVTYNIQAVDAASFRSLVARDPSFIYAVTEQGRRSQPTRRVA